MASSKRKSGWIARLLGTSDFERDLGAILAAQTQISERIEHLEEKLENRRAFMCDADRGTQMLLALQYQALAARGEVLPLQAVEFRNYSQFGEDGILHYLFTLVGAENRSVVEMCAGDGIECNAANLILNHHWQGLLLDGGESNVRRGRDFYKRHPTTQFNPPLFLHRWIRRDNVNAILLEAGFSGEVDLLSLDMDGVDYWIWEALTAILPRVVVLEVNHLMGREPLTVPYSDDFVTRWIETRESVIGTTGGRSELRNVAMYGGASLAAFNKLAKNKGYRLIGCAGRGGNVFFMRNDVGVDIFPAVTEDSCLNGIGEEHVQRGTAVLLAQELERV